MDVFTHNVPIPPYLRVVQLMTLYKRPELFAIDNSIGCMIHKLAQAHP